LLSGYGLAQVPGGPPSEASYKSTARTGSLNASEEHSQRMATPARKQDKADVQQLQYLTSALLAMKRVYEACSLCMQGSLSPGDDAGIRLLVCSHMQSH
jgi:hypothetical protein